MSGPEREDTSFDPRTWGAGESKAAPDTPQQPAKPAQADTTSFDPRAWSAGPDETLPSDETSAPPAGNRRKVAIIAGIALLAAAGGGYALVERGKDAPESVPAATAPAPAEKGEAPARQASRRTLMVAAPQEIASTLSASGVPAAAAAQAAKAALATIGTAAGEIRLEFDLVGTGAATSLTRLEATRADGAGVILTASDSGFSAEKLDAKLTSRVEVVRGEMDGDSFYSSAVAAGVDDSLIDLFADAFSYDFNFATDIAAGDIFEAAFERKVNPAGQSVGKPKLLYVSMTTQAKSRALYRFLAPGESEPGWFDANGRSTVRALMRTPISGARITSNFGPRFHPVLHYTRLHGGTDFAAPVGTPVYAAAGGVVVSASPSACAGNMAILRHDNGWETRYFHLSRYADGIVAGARVTQGQTIGDVGNTGTCTTGPHLHYEVHIDGEKVDPMSIDTGSGVSLTGGGLEAFRKERDRIDKSRAEQAS
ncbi:M23 family metallopeptidase [Sphingomonas sp.]|uniref:M23 family metallopeptidase n=1 Tax=Sphingomonas sp. TaxID=28214 RepID=UPI002DD69F63|nr:M23 family metallopeptidase [Sphingomonas sp.]